MREFCLNGKLMYIYIYMEVCRVDIYIIGCRGYWGVMKCYEDHGGIMGV